MSGSCIVAVVSSVCSPDPPSRCAPGLAWIALVAVGAAGVLVFWAFPALPFQDLPAHAGLIALRARLGTPGGFEARFFVMATRIGPYSLFHWLGAVFAAAMGPVGAVRALATLPVIVTPLALLFARRRLYGDAHPAVGHLGLVLSFGYMTVLGFASYLLGVALLLVGLTLWLELMASVDAREPAAWRREMAVVIVAPMILVTHGHAFLVFLVLAGVCAVAAGARVRRIVRLRPLCRGWRSRSTW